MSNVQQPASGQGPSPEKAANARVDIILQEKSFATGTLTLNYLDHGPSSAAPPLVMLHGGAWRWQEYLSLIPSLAQRWRVYALDLRGNGRSGWLSDKYRPWRIGPPESTDEACLKFDPSTLGIFIGLYAKPLQTPKSCTRLKNPRRRNLLNA